MGCASSHSVRNTQQTVANLQETINQMKSQIETLDQIRLQIRSQAVALQNVETGHQALAKQFMTQVSEHVSLCADFMTFIDIARENEQVPKEIMERVEYLESKIASGLKNELNKVQEQLHNLESSVLLDESDAQTSALDIAYELQDVQKKVFDLEVKLFSEAVADANGANFSGESAGNEAYQVETDQSDGNVSEAALESLFMKVSPSLNRTPSSTHDYDVAGVLDFALLEPDDAFEVEFSSITARARRHAQLMKPSTSYPLGFDESHSKSSVLPSMQSSSTNAPIGVEFAQFNIESLKNVQALTKFSLGSQSVRIGVNDKRDSGSDSATSSDL
jgi:chaperonin cofactor prefoldin